MIGKRIASAPYNGVNIPSTLSRMTATTFGVMASILSPEVPTICFVDSSSSDAASVFKNLGPRSQHNQMSGTDKTHTTPNEPQTKRDMGFLKTRSAFSLSVMGSASHQLGCVVKLFAFPGTA